MHTTSSYCDDNVCTSKSFDILLNSVLKLTFQVRLVLYEAKSAIIKPVGPSIFSPTSTLTHRRSPPDVTLPPTFWVRRLPQSQHISQLDSERRRGLKRTMSQKPELNEITCEQSLKQRTQSHTHTESTSSSRLDQSIQQSFPVSAGRLQDVAARSDSLTNNERKGCPHHGLRVVVPSSADGRRARKVRWGSLYPWPSYR